MPLTASQGTTAEIQEERWVELGLEEVSPPLQQPQEASSKVTGVTVTLKTTTSYHQGKELWTKLALRYLALDLHFRQLSRLPGFLSDGEGKVTLLKRSIVSGSGSGDGADRDPTPVLLSKGRWQCLYLDCSLNRFRSMDNQLWSLQHLLGLDLSSNLLTTTDGFVAPPSLQALILSNNQVRDLHGLRGCTGLTYLDLSFNDELHLEDAFPPMAHHLGTLKLNKCRLARVDELACLRCLHSLEMNDNQLSDIRPLAALARLETLDVCANVIKDMPALATSLSLFKKLSSIGIKGNPVTQQPGYRYAIFDANRGITSVDHTRAAETVLRLIDDSKRHVSLHDSIQHITNEFQQRIEVEQQSMEQQMGGLRSREKELLDRFLAIKDALQREMEESIAYVQRIDLLNAAAEREALTKDAPLQSPPRPAISQEAAPRVGQEERKSGPQDVARSPGIGGSSSTNRSSSSSSSSIPEPPCLDNAGSKACKEHPAKRPSAVNVPTVSPGICSTSIPAPSRPAWHHDDKLEAPVLPTSAPHGEGDEVPRGLQQGTGSDTGGCPGSSKKSPTRWHLRSFFPTKAFKPEGPP